ARPVLPPHGCHAPSRHGWTGRPQPFVSDTRGHDACIARVAAIVAPAGAVGTASTSCVPSGEREAAAGRHAPSDVRTVNASHEDAGSDAGHVRSIVLFRTSACPVPHAPRDAGVNVTVTRSVEPAPIDDADAN